MAPARLQSWTDVGRAGAWVWPIAPELWTSVRVLYGELASTRAARPCSSRDQKCTRAAAVAPSQCCRGPVVWRNVGARRDGLFLLGPVASERARLKQLQGRIPTV